MALSRVERMVKEVKALSAAERLELLRSLLEEGILTDDYFTDAEIAEIEAAEREMARGERVDFDEFRKQHDL